MTVDENFARVILRNPQKITVDTNHTWGKMRFFKISHFSVTYKKITQKDPINVTCYWVKRQSFADRSLKLCQKKKLENDPVTWVNEPLFLGQISVI